MKANHSSTFTAYMKRVVLLAFDASCLATIAAIALSGLPVPAYAYVDPSVMTYTIQAVAGVAVALSAVAGVAFRRTRKALMKSLHIDENAKRKKDPQWHRIESHSDNITQDVDYFGNSIADEAKPEASEVKRRRGRDGDGSDSPSWKARFAFGLVVAFFCSFTLFITAPFEIVAGASADLKYGVSDIWLHMVLFSIFTTVVAAFIVSLFRGKAFSVALIVLFCLGLACYVQAAFLNGGLPEADGRSVDWWGDHSFMMVLSALVWLAILVVPAVLCLKNCQVSRLTAGVLSIALVIVQGVGLLSLTTTAAAAGSGATSGPVAITEDGLFEVSGKNNVIVFVLDCYDTKVFEQVLEEDPAMLDEMDGFTWYRDSSGVMIPTNFAVPYLFTGEVPREDETISDYLVRRYTDSTFLEDLKATNYSVGLYTDSFGLSYLDDETAKSELFDNTINLHAQSGKVNTTKRGTVEALAQCALYRDMPWIIKQFFWFYTDELNSRVIANIDSDVPSAMVYNTDDSGYRDQLNKYGLTINDRGYEGAFRFIHLLGAHYPYSLDENGWFIGVDNSDQMRQARGSMRIVGDYLRQLKDLGLYEGATIIIMSDHGDWYPSMDLPTVTKEPILLYKPSGQGSEEGITRSDAQVSHADFHGTVLSAMGADASKYGPSYDQIPEGEQRTRLFFDILHDQNAHIHGLLEYEIQGNVLDFSNWVYTGIHWETNYDNNLR